MQELPSIKTYRHTLDEQRYLCYQFIHYFHRNRVNRMLVVRSLKISYKRPILRMRLKKLVNKNREFVRFSLFLIRYGELSKF